MATSNSSVRGAPIEDLVFVYIYIYTYIYTWFMST